ncbi:MAG: type II toxin-antitoxin system RelE/ParE family toxin [Nanoarchaeota archaeon]
MSYEIIATNTFSKEFKKHKKDKEFIEALDKKVQRLKEDPNHVGGFLSGKLHEYKSTRIVKKFRLIFKIIEQERKVYLSAIDHRKIIYENFRDD